MKRIILICLVAGIAILLCGCHLLQNTRQPEVPVNTSLQEGLPGDLVYLSFSESSSYFKRVQGYDFLAEDGAYTAYLWMAHEEEPYPAPVDQAWVDALIEIIRSNNMVSWDGFSGSDSMLLDGTRFSVSLQFSDGTTVTAAGYGDFPEHYSEASAAIDAHFLQLLPEDMRDW